MEVAVFSKLMRYLKPEIEITDASQLRVGPARVEGIVAACEAPLKTPFRSRSGVAYTYKVITMVKTRQASMPSVIRDRLHCTEFELSLGETRVRALPKSPGEPVTEEEHNAVQKTENAYVDEEVIPLGHKVRLDGMVDRDGDGWVVSYGTITDLGPAPKASADAPRRGRRRRKGR